MEALLSLLFICLAMGGLGLGLMLGGRPPNTACDGMRCHSARCAGCPRRKEGARDG